MNKNFKYLAFILLPILTIIVWIIWRFLFPSYKTTFLDRVGHFIEKFIYTEKKRRSKGLRNYAAKKSGRK